MQCTASLIITLSARQLRLCGNSLRFEDYSTTQRDEISQIIGISLQSETELSNPENFLVLPNSIGRFRRVFSSKNVMSVLLQLADTQSVLHLPSKRAYRAWLAQTVWKPCSKSGPSVQRGDVNPDAWFPFYYKKHPGVCPLPCDWCDRGSNATRGTTLTVPSTAVHAQNEPIFPNETF